MKRKILYSVRVIIGVVFIVSGLGKAVNTATFGDLIVQYGLERLQIFAPLIVIIEIAVGLCLILSIKPKVIGLISACLLLIFTAVFTYGYFKTGITDCGCFGVFTTGQDNILLIYARNILLIGLSLYVGLCHSSYRENSDETKKIILLGVMLPVIFVSGLTYKIPASFRLDQSHSLLNKHIKETPLHQYLKTVPERSYLAFFHTYSCPHCWNSMENFKQFKESGMVDSIVSLALVNTDFDKNSEIRDAFITNLGNLESREIVNDDAVQSFIKAVPTSFYVKNDTIKAVIESILPHPFIFGRKYGIKMKQTP